MSSEAVLDQVDVVYFGTGACLVGTAAPQHPVLRTLTVCIMVMRDGSVVLGQSAPGEGVAFDGTVGRAMAFDDATERARCRR